MKIGDYVRNKYGIAKIIDIEHKYGIDIIVFDRKICFMYDKETKEEVPNRLFNRLPLTKEIDLTKIKSSSNIIDLIEEGDLIKIEYELASGEKQNEILEVIRSNSIEHKLFVNSWLRKCYIEDFDRYDINIKSIVTKEQFESMKYKI